MKNNDSAHWPGTTPDERGKLAEEAFLRAWENANKLQSWIVTVCKPTEFEDLEQKTDAVMICISGENLKFQIKSYPMSKAHELELIEYGVIPIYILAHNSSIDIRLKTYRSLKKFNEFHQKLLSNGQLNRVKLKKLQYRKRRKKRR